MAVALDTETYKKPKVPLKRLYEFINSWQDAEHPQYQQSLQLIASAKHNCMKE